MDPAEPSTATATTGAARAEASRTAECSTAEQTTGPGSARVAPHTAALMASVPPEVNTTWRGRTPNSSATWSRASSSAARTMRPSVWIRPGSAVGAPLQPLAPWRRSAAGRRGVVDAWSR